MSIPVNSIMARMDATRELLQEIDQKIAFHQDELKQLESEDYDGDDNDEEYAAFSKNMDMKQTSLFVKIMFYQRERIRLLDEARREADSIYSSSIIFTPPPTPIVHTEDGM